MNAKDQRIQKLGLKGVSVPRIAARIGDPNDIARVLTGLKRSGLSPLEKMAVEFERNACKCGKQERSEVPHTCPYAVEIFEDNRECSCCSDCRNACREDV